MSAVAASPTPTFKLVTENIVKSVKQRHLARCWERLRGANELPSWSQMDANDLSASRDHLCVVDVRREGATIRFLIREHGEKLSEYYGSACRGKHLDEITAVDAFPALLAIYAQAIETRRPVYTVAPVTDSKGRPVTFERLLLPFASNGSSADIILASVEAISIEGAFDSLRVLEISQRRPIPGFHGIIGAPVA